VDDLELDGSPFAVDDESCAGLEVQLHAAIARADLLAVDSQTALEAGRDDERALARVLVLTRLSDDSHRERVTAHA
jgi:hypothetical protein